MHQLHRKYFKVCAQLVFVSIEDCQFGFSRPPLKSEILCFVDQGFYSPVVWNHRVFIAEYLSPRHSSFACSDHVILLNLRTLPRMCYIYVQAAGDWPRCNHDVMRPHNFGRHHTSIRLSQYLNDSPIYS